MNATTPTPADTAKTIKALRKRLERWELEHLRQLAASLADRLEAAEQRIEPLRSKPPAPGTRPMPGAKMPSALWKNWRPQAPPWA